MEEHTTGQEQCFVIMPISDKDGYTQGHFDKVYEQIFKPAITKAGFEPYRVDENKISDSIINKIFDAVQNSPMALCDLSSRNPNVLYELGLRQAYDKPVVLVQDERTEKIFDVAGINTVFYDSSRVYEKVIEAQEKISEAITATVEGKENSIVKVVKVHKAEIDSSTPSNDEAMKILLMSLSNEVSEMKEELKRKERRDVRRNSYSNYLNGDDLRLSNSDYTEKKRKQQLENYRNNEDVEIKERRAVLKERRSESLL